MDISNDLQMKLKAMGPYAVRICTTMLQFGEAVELCLNLKDRAVLAEMRNVTNEIFEQAEKELQDDPRGVQ